MTVTTRVVLASSLVSVVGLAACSEPVGAAADGTSEGSGSGSTVAADDGAPTTSVTSTSQDDGDGGSGSGDDGSADSTSSADDSATDSGGADCGGGCDAPFVCTPAGYCATEAGVPQFDHVYVVIFENRSLTSVMGNAPYLDGLATMGAYATQYGSITHPSLPNYIAMTSGDTWDIGCDCHPGSTATCDNLSCNLLLSSCDCPRDVEHIGDQLDAADITWRTYGESMGTPCNTTDSSADHYAAKHLPFLYYDNVLSDDSRCQEHVRDYGDFAADLASGSYRFTMISPNLCSDMHDTCGRNPVMHGDDWASQHLPPILATEGFQPGGRDVLFVVWDEQDNSVGTDPIPFIVISPLIDPGTITPFAYDHYSLLATWEDAFGLPRLANATTAMPIADIWR